MTVLIDLGELGAGPPPVPPPSRRRRPRPGAHRWTAAALVLVSLFAGLTAASPAVRLELLYTLVARTATATADAENLYVVSRPGRETALTAYRLVDGTRRWRRPVGGMNADAEIEGVRVLPNSGYALVVLGVCADLSDARTMLIDPSTGDTRWSRPGTPLAAAPDGRVLLVRGPAGRCGGGDPGLDGIQATVTGVEPDGTPAWSYRVPQPSVFDVAVDPDRRPRWLVTVGPDARVQVRDAVTGRLVTDGHVDPSVLPHLADAGPFGSALTVGVVGDLLLLSTVGGVPARVSAYGLATLQPRWTVHIGVPRLPGAYVFGMPCGRLLCLAYSGGVLAVHPATGGTGWTRDLSLVGEWGTRLLGTDGDPAGTPRIVDSETGRSVASVPGWHVLPGLGPPSREVVVQRRSGRSTTLAVVDLVSGRLRMVGTVSRPVNGCTPVGTGVVCTSNEDVVRGWRPTV